MYLIVSGTNRKNSNARIIADLYADLLKDHGRHPEILDLRELPADFIVTALYDNTGKNRLFNQFQEQVDAAEKIVFVVSEYNASFPGVLKAFIDGLRYPDSLTDKKGALVGVSAGPTGGILALSHMNDILTYLGMYLLPDQPRLGIIENHLEQGRLENDLYRELLEDQVRRLIAF